MSFGYSHVWTITASATEVFRALTEPVELRQWFALGAQVEPRVGGVYRFWGRHTLATPPEDAARQTIIRFEPNVLLAFEWPINEIDTDVTIRLAPARESTTFSLTHTVSGDLHLPQQGDVIGDFWSRAISNLIAHLAGSSDISLPDYFSSGTNDGTTTRAPRS